MNTMKLSKIILSPFTGQIGATLSGNSSLNCLKCSLLCLSLLFLQTVNSQTSWTELDKELTAKQSVLGDNVVVMVLKGDSVVYKKEMGGFDVKTVAPIASCSKWLTAALVMQFVDEGKISLDDKVSKYLPEFEKYGKNYITIRYCLSHMTGINDEGGLIKRLLQRKKFNSLEEEVNSFAAREIRSNPGTDFWYGNVGLNIAARILEVISKKKFDLLIKSKLFNPLGMRKTSFSVVEGAVNPSGGAVSTAEDYMKFLTMLLHNGKYNGLTILSENAVKQMRQIQNIKIPIAYAPKSAEGYRYALGSWVLENGDAAQAGELPTASVIACPGLFGTWPMVDFCRGYAYICFVKSYLGEERADVQRNIKSIIEQQFKSDCQ